MASQTNFSDLEYKAEKGDTEAEYELGVHYANLNDHNRSTKYLKRAARKGHYGAESYLRHNAPASGIARWAYMNGLYPSKLVSKLLQASAPD